MNTNYLLILLAFLIALVSAWFIIRQVMQIAFQKKLFDEPNQRKLHSYAVPRLGGITFFPVMMFALSLVLAIMYQYRYDFTFGSPQIVLPKILLLLCGLMIVYLVGVRDDLIGVRYRTKFLFQIIAAAFLPLSGLWINNLYGFLGVHELTPWIGMPLTVFVVVTVMNAINLIDGIDGLAAGLCCIGLIMLGAFLLYAKVWFCAMFAFIGLGAVVPFLYYNLFGIPGENKIFMGDTGSLTLGYILSFLAIRLSVADATALPYMDGAIVIAFSSLMVPVLDVCRVMLVRARNKQHLFTADKNHIHHKFLMMGFSHRGAMLRIMGVAVFFCILNILLAPYINVTIIVLINIAAWLSLHLLFNSAIQKVASKELEDSKSQEAKSSSMKGIEVSIPDKASKSKSLIIQ